MWFGWGTLHHYEKDFYYHKSKKYNKEQIYCLIAVCELIMVEILTGGIKIKFTGWY